MSLALDLFIIIFLILGIWDGYRRGFFREFFNLIALVLGFLIALFAYHFLAQSVIVSSLGWSLEGAELFSFIFLLIFSTFLFSTLSHLLISYLGRPQLVEFDEIAGAIFGFFTTLVLIGALLLLASVLPASYKLGPILEQSKIAPPLIRTISSFYEKIENKIVGRLPRLIKYPEEIFPKQKYREIISGISEKEWEALDGATCFACGGKVKYMGLKKHIIGGEEVISPYFVCQKCGRHSDSCQTFEGYHKLYGECPAKLAKLGYRFDCGMWPNGNFVKPKGKCPVCGEVAEHEHEKIPWVIAYLGYQEVF